ncbi:MAG: MOSC domain-containing protein [Myxococcota bacterium]
MQITVTQLWRYPLKSAAGVPIQESAVLPRGLADDRRWMLVDDHRRFITSRTQHQLVTVSAARTSTGLRLDDTLDVPIPPEDGPRVAVKIWSDTVEARLAHPGANQWISERLGVSARLVYMGDETRRPVDPNYAGTDDVVSFADGFPLLLISQASLDELNGRLETPVTMQHFRPNVVVGGCPPFAEDDWTHVEIGAARFSLVKRCSRCVLTTIDPQTGQRDPGGEPIKTLSTYRRVKGKIMFGQNLLVAQGGMVRVGDVVRLR